MTVLEKTLEAKDWFEHMGEEEISAYYEDFLLEDFSSQAVKNTLIEYLTRENLSSNEVINFIEQFSASAERQPKQQVAFETENRFLLINLDQGKNCITNKEGYSLCLEVIPKEIDFSQLGDDDD